MARIWVSSLRAIGLATLVAGSVYADVYSQDDALRMARQQNPEVRAAYHTWQVALAAAMEAGAVPNPELEIEYEGLSSITGIDDFAERTIGIRQQIGWPGQWWFNRRAARRNAEVVRLGQFVAAEVDVAARVRIAFGALLHATAALEHSRQSAELARDFLDKARTRHEAGDVSQLEVLRADVAVHRADSRVMEATHACTIERGRLNVLLGQAADTDLVIVGLLGQVTDPPELAALQQLAKVQRPDLSAARVELASLRATRSAERAALVPDLSLGIFRQTVRQPAGDDQAWRLGVGMEIPLWFASKQRGRLASVAAQEARVEAQLVNLERQINLQVREATLMLDTARRQAALYRDRIVPEAQQAQQVARRSYDAGKAGYLDVLQAQQILTEIRVEYIDRLFACHRAQATLHRAIGGRWSLSQPEKTQ